MEETKREHLLKDYLKTVEEYGKVTGVPTTFLKKLNDEDLVNCIIEQAIGMIAKMTGAHYELDL